MLESKTTNPPPYDETRGVFVLLAAIGSAFFGVGADSMLKPDLIRSAVSVGVGLIFFLLAFNWHRIAPRLPQQSAHFVGKAALDARLWAVIVIATFGYLSYPMIYDRIWSSFIDPQQFGAPSVSIQFNDGSGAFEILKSNNINVLIGELPSQVVVPGECKKHETPASGLGLTGTNFFDNLIPECAPAQARDDYKTTVYLSAQHYFFAESLTVNSHGARIPKYKVTLSGRQAVILFSGSVTNAVVDISFSPKK